MEMEANVFANCKVKSFCGGESVIIQNVDRSGKTISEVTGDIKKAN